MTAVLYAFLASSIVLAQVGATYTVGVHAVDYYPIGQAQAPDLAFRGYARDVLDRFAHREGIHFNYVALPPKRMLIEYWGNRLDLVFPDNPNWDKEQKAALNVTYSAPVVTFGDAVFTRPWRKTEDVAQLQKLGVLLGWTPWKFADRIKDGKLRAVTAPNPNSLLQMALNGRVDGANLAEPVARYQLAQLGMPKALVPNRQWMPLKQSHYHISSIQHADIVHRFDQFLREDEPYLAKLRAQYGL